jgi:hypothetical protein
MGKALQYLIKHWLGLCRYLDDPKLEIDNNLVENAIRPTAVGKKNWLFFGDAEAGKSSAALPVVVENIAIQRRSKVSGVTQNRPLKVEIRGFKTSHFLEGKTALVGLVTAGPEGHVECPESEPANDDTQFSRSRVVTAPDCTRTWDQSRDRWPVFALSR